MSEFLIHFGVHKTGSSSIQATLFGTRANRVAGYVHGGTANGSQLVRDAFATRGASWHSRANGAAISLPALRRLAGRLRWHMAIRAARAKSDRLILSAEAIAHFHDADLATLLDAVRAVSPSPVFLGYVREPVGFLRSAFQEKIKTKLGAGFEFAPDRPRRLNLHGLIERLDAAVGADNVRVFAFDRALFPQGDVVRHFLEQAGIDPSSVTIRRVNEGLSMLGVKALYTYRRLRVANDLTLRDPRSRAAFVAELADLGGEAFALHPEIEARIAADNTALFDWSETRLGQRLRVPERHDDRGIRIEDDLLAFSPAELERLATWAQARGQSLPARPDAQAVADCLHAVRLACFGKRV